VPTEPIEIRRRPLAGEVTTTGADDDIVHKLLGDRAPLKDGDVYVSPRLFHKSISMETSAASNTRATTR